MSKKNTFDVIVIGSGSAGFSAIESAVAQGASVCVVEQGRLGGECPNSACVPSKAVLKSAEVYRLLARVREYGLDASGKSFQWKNVHQYQHQVMETITGGGEVGDRYVQILKKLKVTYRLGSAQFVDEHTIEVNGEELQAKAFVLATGTTDFIPPISGLDQIPYWGWKKALQTKRQPKSVAIIGGGPVGCELATFFATFGTRTVLLQASSTVLTNEDQEISERAMEALMRVGVDVVPNVRIVDVVNGRVGVMGLNVEVEGEQTMYAVEQVVLATGKRSNVGGLRLERAGVQLDAHGNLKTDVSGRTNVKHIFGAGDVDGGPLFTHTAHYEGAIAGYNSALTALKKKTARLKRDERVVPRVTFVDPEVASVGMTQQQVREAYGRVLVGRCDVSMLGRAVTESNRNGLIKLVAHPKTRKLLGAHFICPHAGELVHETALAIYLGATVDKLATMIHAYPTYAEGIKVAASLSRLE